MDIGNVVGDDQRRPANAANVSAPGPRGPSKKKNRRSRQQVMGRQAQPGSRPAQGPSWVVKTRITKLAANTSFTLQQFFQIADGRCIRELGFAQVHLVAVFKGTEQFDSLQGA